MFQIINRFREHHEYINDIASDQRYLRDANHSGEVSIALSKMNLEYSDTPDSSQMLITLLEFIYKPCYHRNNAQILFNA